MEFSKYKISLFFLMTALVVSCTSEEKRALSMNSLFADHMVLQQNSDVALWGEYTPKSKVIIRGSWGEETTSTVDKDGKWKTTLSTPAAGGPYDLHIETKDSAIHLSDVLIGEVWLASGQSNMEMPLTGFLPIEPIDNYKEEISNAHFPQIRFINVTKTISLSPKDDIVGSWQVTSPETADKCSASAYFFARKLHQVLGIPIGIIHSSWGGTPVESWIAPDKIVSMGELEEKLAALQPEKAAVYEKWFSKFPTVPGLSSDDNWGNFSLDDEKYISASYDDTTWESTDITTRVEQLTTTTNDGAYWFRTKVNIEDLSSDYVLEISEGIDDSDVTYVNGEKVGWTHCWNCPRKYEVPVSILKKGDNVISIRVIDTGGGGGFSEAVTMSNTSGSKITIDKGWRYKQVADYRSGNFVLFEKNIEALNNPPEGLSTFSVDANSPGVLFKGMIHPLIPFTLKGAIWYQGESNVGRHDQYLKLFPGMIEDWRELWGQEFPFYFVQIAPWHYGDGGMSPWLRDAQRKSLQLPNTGMAITMDIGDKMSIHPGNKQDVGDRLARLALKRDYKKDIVPSGPLYKNHVVQGNKLIVQFSYSEGLSSRDMLGFEIAGEDMKFVTAQASIFDSQVELSATSVPNPKHVRYGWKDFTKGTLINGSGLPASSFTSEW